MACDRAKASSYVWNSSRGIVFSDAGAPTTQPNGMRKFSHCSVHREDCSADARTDSTYLQSLAGISDSELPPVTAATDTTKTPEGTNDYEVPLDEDLHSLQTSEPPQSKSLFSMPAELFSDAKRAPFESSQSY